MKIRLIQPSHLDARGQVHKFQRLFMPTLSLLTVAALTPRGVDVALSLDAVEDLDFDERVDLVGIGALTAQAPRAYQIAREYRRRGRKVVMGGIHASMCPEEALEHVDAVLVGEAEEIWPQIVDDARRGQLQRRYQAPRQPDLSQLVIPRFDLLRHDLHMKLPFEAMTHLPIQTTRGCPFDCSFCSVVAYLGHRMRKKPVAHVIREIESVGPKKVLFADDNIIGDPDYARELFRALRPLDIRFFCQMGTNLLKHPDLMDLAAEAGCSEALFGIESTNVASLRAVNKHHNRPASYPELFRRLRSAGILAHASVVFGFDEDTVESLRAFVDEALGWDVNYLLVNALTPLPGTRLYKEAQAQGRLLTSDWSAYDCFHPTIASKGITPVDLERSIWEAWERFFAPARIAERAYRFRREYVVHRRRNNLALNVFIQGFMGHVARQRRHHPLAGFGLISSG
jgi:radical SAM superfamily enzyme YgiQ (UPF0313 family)